MFRCLKCKTIIDPDDVRYTEEYGRSVGYCPCGWDELEPVEPCIRCGEYILESDWLCEDCRENIKDEARTYFVGYLKQLNLRELRELDDDLGEVLGEAIDIVKYEKKQADKKVNGQYDGDRDREPRDLIEEA